MCHKSFDFLLNLAKCWPVMLPENNYICIYIELDITVSNQNLNKVPVTKFLAHLSLLRYGYSYHGYQIFQRQFLVSLVIHVYGCYSSHMTLILARCYLDLHLKSQDFLLAFAAIELFSMQY